MKSKLILNRRHVLRGLGATIALPMLEAMVPNVAQAAHSCSPDTPQRLLFSFNPNGTVMSRFTPERLGADWQSTIVTEPLHQAGLVDDVSILSNLINTPGQGGHQECAGAALTATRPMPGSAVSVGDSIDQVYAQACAGTPFRSLQLGLRPSLLSGTAQGFPSAYSTTQSFSNQTPLPVQIDPEQIFDSLFGATRGVSEQAYNRRRRMRLSVLDFARDDLEQLKGRLGQCDQHRLDEYMTGLRALETRIQDQQFSNNACGTGVRPTGVNPSQNQETAIRLMHDLIVKAFECDLTRSISFMRWGVGASDGNLSYSHINNYFTGQHIEMQYHQASHYGHSGNENQTWMDVCTSIERWEVSMFAELLNKLKSVQEGDGTLLDNCGVLHYSTMDSSQYHRSTEGLPLILAGRLGGQLNPGRHIGYPPGTELGNLHLSLLRKVGVDINQFGETGVAQLDDL